MILKRAFLIFIVFLSLNVVAQHKPFQFGFKAAANLGWYNTTADNYSNNGADFGGSWGFIADIYIMENYSFTTGFDVLYLNGAMSYPSVYEQDTVSPKMQGVLLRSYRTKYIEIPFVLTMKTDKINNIRYYGQIGFGLGLLLAAKANDEFTPDKEGSMITNTHNIYDQLRLTRESLILGAGIEMPLHGSTYLRIGLAYDNAFINILNGYNTVNASIKNNGRNSFFKLEVSVLF